MPTDQGTAPANELVADRRGLLIEEVGGKRPLVEHHLLDRNEDGLDQVGLVTDSFKADHDLTLSHQDRFDRFRANGDRLCSVNIGLPGDRTAPKYARFFASRFDAQPLDDQITQV